MCPKLLPAWQLNFERDPEECAYREQVFSEIKAKYVQLLLTYPQKSVCLSSASFY